MADTQPISALLAQWQQQIDAAAADQRAAIVADAEASLGAIYHDAPDGSPVREQALAAWNQVNALAGHAAQQEAIASGATAAAAQIARNHAALVDEHEDLLTALDVVDRRHHLVDDVYSAAYDDAQESIYTTGMSEVANEIEEDIIDTFRATLGNLHYRDARDLFLALRGMRKITRPMADQLIDVIESLVQR